MGVGLSQDDDILQGPDGYMWVTRCKAFEAYCLGSYICITRRFGKGRMLNSGPGLGAPCVRDCRIRHHRFLEKSSHSNHVAPGGLIATGSSTASLNHEPSTPIRNSTNSLGGPPPPNNVIVVE